VLGEIDHASVTCAPVGTHSGTEQNPQVRVVVAIWTGCLDILTGTHVINNLGNIERIRLVFKLCICGGCSSLQCSAAAMSEVVTSNCFPMTIEERVGLAAIPGEVGVELNDQLCICRGGDGFEQFLQPATLKLLDCPLGGFKIFEVIVDVELGLK
jgi:hypothetical protein